MKSLLWLAVAACGTSAPQTPPDAAFPDPCADCPTDHVCVIKEQNVCMAQAVTCVLPDPGCPAPTFPCSAACHDIYCASNVYSCDHDGCEGRLPSSPRAIECVGY